MEPYDLRGYLRDEGCDEMPAKRSSCKTHGQKTLKLLNTIRNVVWTSGGVIHRNGKR